MARPGSGPTTVRAAIGRQSVRVRAVDDIAALGAMPMLVMSVLVVLTATAVALATPAVAQDQATITSLAWKEGSDPVFMLETADKPPYEVEVLDGGYRLRLRLDGTRLGNAVRDIGERGYVRGVFPYESNDPRRTNIDILLRMPAKLEVLPVRSGYTVAVLPAEEPPTAAADAETVQPQPPPDEQAEPPGAQESVAAGESVPTLRPETPSAVNGTVPAPPDIVGSEPAEEPQPRTAPEPSRQVAQQPLTPGTPVLHGVSHTRLPGGRVQIDFATSGLRDEPGVFRTTQPPRIILDFFGAGSTISTPVMPVGSGAVESIVTAQSDDRTRVVVNLVASVPYASQNLADGVRLVIESPETVAAPTATTTARQPRFVPEAAEPPRFQVTNVDFRRAPEGGGKVIVSLSHPEVPVDMREEAGEIIVDFLDTALPAELEQRLDVVDFATPVQTVDTFRVGDRTRMVVSPVGRYSHSSYLVGDTLTVHVAPIIEGAEDREVDEFGYSGERLSLNFQNISVRAALQVIADFTGLNFVTSDSVSGELTLRLKDVPWDQALDTIMQIKGLAKRERGNVVWVAPAEEITAKERAALEAQQQVRDLEPLVSELIQINYASAEDIAALLKSVKSVDTGFQQSPFGSVTISEIETERNTLLSPRGNVTVDPRTNSILIQDTADKIREVRELIAKLDRPVRQVLIETRIVEANDDFSRTIGARLGFTRITENARFPGSGSGNIGTVFQSGTLENTNAIRNTGLAGSGEGAIGVDLPASGIGDDTAASYAFTIAKAGAGFAHLIDLEISALEAEGRGKVIANPRLLTADQQEARIEQGQERIFTTSFLGEGGVVTKKAVLSLTVTPQITPDDRLVLDVIVTKDSFVSPDEPTIDTKQVETQVLLDNGETVVIGGIYQQTEVNSVTKVPLLGDIPLLGALFRKKSVVDNRTELLVFLTPRIISPALTVR